MKLKSFFSTLALGCISFATQAHALWIETAFTGKVGQKQEINIYYGEYAEGEKDSTAKWYSDVKSFTLWVVDAKNNKTQLTTTDATTRFTATFTPAAEGVYTLLVQHPVKDFPGETRYEFAASATVSVGKAGNVPQNSNTLNVSAPTTAVVDKPVTIKSTFNGKPSQEVHFDVISPTGWAKKFKADANGDLTFTPLWPGTYFIEAMHNEKAAGEFGGKAYKGIWRGATHTFEVRK